MRFGWDVIYVHTLLQAAEALRFLWLGEASLASVLSCGPWEQEGGGELDLHREGALRAVRSCSDWFAHLAVSGPWFPAISEGWECHSFIAHPAQLLFRGDRKSSAGHNKNLCQWSILGGTMLPPWQG